ILFNLVSSFQQVDKPEMPKISLSERFSFMKDIAIQHYYYQYKEPLIPQEQFRMPYTGAKYNGDDVVLAGCSVTKGDGLKSDDTFGAVLTEMYPKWRAYNIGVSGGSARETLYILRNYKNFENWGVLPKNPQNTKYFIYTFFAEHKIRIYHDLYRRGPKFDVKKDKNGQKYLEYREKTDFLSKTFMSQYFTSKCCLKSEKYLNNLLTLYMQEIKKEVDSIFPNSQLVFFVFYGDEDTFDMPALEKMGIKVVLWDYISDVKLWDDKYKTWDKLHPSRLAWETILPYLGKELDL
ncbi:MAG: hypothetical protein Q4E87_02220, partial [bacterium]|nr:hypothetical protein [bacterium]